MSVTCMFSTIGRTVNVGGKIGITYHFVDSDEKDTSPASIHITLKAAINVSQQGCRPVHRNQQINPEIDYKIGQVRE